MTCNCKKEGMILWKFSVNEDGWYCKHETYGFRPDFDRELIRWKVNDILHFLNNSKLITVSNGTDGEILTHNASELCKEANYYDQYYICLMLFTLDSGKDFTHSKFWEKESNKFFEGDQKNEKITNPNLKKFLQ